VNRKMLQKALATLPPNLDQTYDRILDAIDEDYFQYALRILQWLTFSARPLPIDEVAEVVALDGNRDPAFDRDEVLEDPLEVLNICSSLVTMAVDDDSRLGGPSRQVVVLAHYSVKEYLVSDRICIGKAAKYSMRDKVCHGAIAISCLGYLLQFQQSELRLDLLDSFKLARYSAEFWTRHFMEAGERRKGVREAAIRLCCKKDAAYVNWVRLWDPDTPQREPNLQKDREEIHDPLYYAAHLDLRDVVKFLLGKGADVNAHGGYYDNALQVASFKGYELMVRLLCDNGAEVNAQGGHFGNALQAASFGGHEPVVRLLLDKNADANAQGGIYGNALQAASAKGYEQIAKLLLSAHAAVNMQGGYYSHALHAALVGTHEPTVRLLLERGAKVGLDVRLKGAMHHALNNASCTPSLARMLQQYGAPLDTTDTDNMSPLHYCVKFSHKIMAKQLIDAGVRIDLRVHRQSRPSEVSESTSGRTKLKLPASEPESVAIGLTPLHFAALTGNLTMTEFLLEHSADPNALSDYGETPLHLTLRTALFGTKYQDDWTDSYLRAEVLRDFLDFEEDDIDAVLAEISYKRIGVLYALLSDPRISLNVTDYKGESPLHCIRYGEPESASSVRILVSRGADLSNINLCQQSPLHFASKSGDHASVKALLLSGAKVALVDEHGLNALHYAARSGNHETIISILETDEARAVNLIASKDKSGRNVLHHLLSTHSIKHVETVRSLLDQRAHGSELDHSGISPLARFIKSSMLQIDIEICRSLLEIKENASFVDCDGQTLGHLCAGTADFGVQILNLLVEYGVDLVKRDRDGRTVLHRAAMCGSLTEQSLGFLTNVISIRADEEDTYGRTALQYATELAAKDRSSNIWDSKRWERTRDILQKSHANRMNDSCSSCA
jgi:ankyrin repeat protein